MPRYIVERTFPDGLRIPMTGEGAVACLGVVGRNADLGVTWIQLVRQRRQEEDLLRVRRA